MKEKNNILSLEEVLKLAKKVRNWNSPYEINLDEFNGSVNSVCINMDKRKGGFIRGRTDYSIFVKNENLDLGDYYINTKKQSEVGEQMYQLFKDAEKIMKRNESKKRRDTITYVKRLISD